MKSFVVQSAVLLVLWSVGLVSSKFYSECDFVVEIHDTHQVHRDEIFLHLCVAEGLHTRKNAGGYIGIYGVSHEAWCHEDHPGGGCNVTCSDLLDDDIADDVACANTILAKETVRAWGTTERKCRATYEHKVRECLDELGVFDESHQEYEEYEDHEDHEHEDSHEHDHEHEHEYFTYEHGVPHQVIHECSCLVQNLILLVIVLLLAGALAGFVFKYNRLKRHFDFKNEEFSNNLVI
jgi:lysozyme C